MKAGIIKKEKNIKKTKPKTPTRFKNLDFIFNISKL